MNFLNFYLPVLLYVVGIILLVVLIILGIRLLAVLEKFERVIDNIDSKINSLNSAFCILDKTTDGLAMISDTVIIAISNIISKIFNRKKNKIDKEEEANE